MRIEATKLHNGIRIAVPAALLTAANGAMAAATDYSSLTTAVNWDAVITSLLAVGVAIIGVTVAFVGIKKVIKMARGG